MVNVLKEMIKYPDSTILLNFDDDEYSQGYGLNEKVSGAPTKGDILHPYISDHDFRVCNGYKLYVFDKQYHRNLTADQPIKVEHKFDEPIPYHIKQYALVLTNILVSKSSDGQRNFDMN